MIHPMHTCMVIGCRLCIDVVVARHGRVRASVEEASLSEYTLSGCTYMQMALSGTWSFEVSGKKMPPLRDLDDVVDPSPS